MKKAEKRAITTENAASVIEHSPVRLTSDETRLMLRMAQSTAPIDPSYNGRSILELGLAEEVPMMTEAEKKKRNVEAWNKLRLALTARDLELAKTAVREIEKSSESNSKTGFVLTDLGKQVARGITVRITKR